MADHEALIEISMGRRTFKISGSEVFVEKMIDILPTLLPMNDEPEEEEEPSDLGDSSKGDGAGREHETIDAFVERLGIDNDTSATKKVGAFVYFLTEVLKKPTCSPAQIEECFDLTGLKTPGNLGNAINNAKAATHGSYIRSAGRGQYAVTTNGKNLVKEMTKGG